MNSTWHKIIHGDSRCMQEVEPESVHLVVTSPPYWQLKDYGTDNQIGFHDDYETYIHHLNLVWQECYRILHTGCRLCINIGDQFARANYYGRYKVIPIHAEIIKFCEAVGFDFMGQIIWQKQTTMNTSGGASIMGSYPTPRNGIVKLDFEYILLFKKPGESPKPTNEQKENSIMTKEEWNTYFNGHWYFGGAKQDKHLAMFPEELPTRLIKMFSFPQEIVLDPFMGSGTTALTARKLNRNSIGYEINNNFIPIIQDKINYIDLLSDVSIVLEEQTLNIDFEERIQNLPYQFIDTHKLDKKVDVKLNQYGSKLDKDSKPKEEYFTVKEVLSPSSLKLSNGSMIYLMGILEKETTKEEAIVYLEQKVKGKQVFLRYDTMSINSNDQYVYLYLKNKTFINAHLLKEKLVLVNTNHTFKYKTKFMELEHGKEKNNL